MGTRKYDLRHEIMSGPMKLVSGGDGDICTKDGRKTRVRLFVGSLHWASRTLEWGGLGFGVSYRVTELVTNNTELYWEHYSWIYPPQDVWLKLNLEATKLPASYDRTWEVQGGQHGEMAVPETAGTIVESGTYSIDGMGEDFTNAKVKLTLYVPLYYNT